MKNIKIKEGIIPDIEELLVLYNDVGWYAYTENEQNLIKSLRNSLSVYTVWHNDKLVGLARIVGDKYTIIYIQDILILKSYQGNGIGSRLLQTILDRYKNIRQLVLMTEETEDTIKFYQQNGLKRSTDYGCIAFMK